SVEDVLNNAVQVVELGGRPNTRHFPLNVEETDLIGRRTFVPVETDETPLEELRLMPSSRPPRSMAQHRHDACKRRADLQDVPFPVHARISRQQQQPDHDGVGLPLVVVHRLCSKLVIDPSSILRVTLCFSVSEVESLYADA